MKLSHTKIETARPGEKTRKLPDGAGLYLRIVTECLVQTVLPRWKFSRNAA